MSPTDPFPPEVIKLALDVIATGEPLSFGTPRDIAAARDIAQAFHQRQIERALGQVDAALAQQPAEPPSPQ